MEDSAPVQARTGAVPVLSLTVILAIYWILWSGIYDKPLLWIFGAISCLGVVLLCHRMGLIDSFSVPVHMTGRFLVYIPWLAKKVVTSNFSVLRHILRPRPDHKPRLIRVPLSQKSDLGAVSYANSITLTPGTFTLEAGDKELVVHALTPRSAASVLRGEMNRRVTRLEGLD